MDKQCTIIGCSTIDRLKHAIDWSLCVICQKTSHKQALVCPVESKLRKTGDGYLTLESDLLGFESVNSLPSTVNLNEVSKSPTVLEPKKKYFRKKPQNTGA